MDARRSQTSTLRRVAVMAALAALMAPAGVAEAAKRKKIRYPVVTSVSPKTALVGETITLRGRNFRAGKGTNSVAFKRDGLPALLVRADVATRRMLRVVLSERLEDVMLAEGGTLVPTRFRVRVLARRFGRRFTAAVDSPVIGPKPAPASATSPAPPAPPAPPADGDCDADGTLNGADSDDDNDLLSDELEGSIKTDTCKRDSDDDGVEDGYEYRSAVDLNDDEFKSPNVSLPYPARRPYPNPLFAGDKDSDFDGDGLTLTEEYKLWVLTTTGSGVARDLSAVSYSDGMQHSLYTRQADGRRTPSQAADGYNRHQDFLAWAGSAGYNPVLINGVDAWWYEPRTAHAISDLNRDGAATARDLNFGDGVGYLRSEATYFDMDQNGFLDDGERDEDADGLNNFDEAHGCMSGESWWSKMYDKETAYPTMKGRAGTALDVADTDGDGVRDGADDADADDLPNIMECSRQAASGRPIDPREAEGEELPDPPSTPLKGFVHPFNPCLPSTKSRTCDRNPEIQGAHAPFNVNDEYYWVYQ